MTWKLVLLCFFTVQRAAAQGVLDSVFANPTLASLTSVLATATDPSLIGSISSEVAVLVNAGLSSASGTSTSNAGTGSAPSTGLPPAQSSSNNSPGSSTALSSVAQPAPVPAGVSSPSIPSVAQSSAVAQPLEPSSDGVPASIASGISSLGVQVPESSSLPSALDTQAQPAPLQPASVEVTTTVLTTAQPATVPGPLVTVSGAVTTATASELTTVAAPGTLGGAAAPLNTPQITSNPAIPQAASAIAAGGRISIYVQSFLDNPGIQTLSAIWASISDPALRSEISVGVGRVFDFYASEATARPRVNPPAAPQSPASEIRPRTPDDDGPRPVPALSPGQSTVDQAAEAQNAGISTNNAASPAPEGTATSTVAFGAISGPAAAAAVITSTSLSAAGGVGATVGSAAPLASNPNGLDSPNAGGLDNGPASGNLNGVSALSGGPTGGIGGGQGNATAEGTTNALPTNVTNTVAGLVPATAASGPVAQVTGNQSGPIVPAPAPGLQTATTGSGGSPGFSAPPVFANRAEQHKNVTAALVFTILVALLII